MCVSRLLGISVTLWATLLPSVLYLGSIQPLLMELTADSKVSMLLNSTWTLSNLCQYKPPQTFDKVHPAIVTLAHLSYFDNEEVLAAAYWAL